MRIVLDTATFVTAVRSSAGAAGEVLRMVFRQQVVPLMDLKLSLEYRAVALRPAHVRASMLTLNEITELIETTEAFAEPIRVRAQSLPLSPDPNDDMVIALAISGRADALITNNRKHFFILTARYGIPVLTPGEFLVHYRRNSDA